MDIIATIWDFDKTLIPGYMQDPIFKEYGVDPKTFWEENNKAIKDLRAQGYAVNADAYYLNRFIEKSKKGGAFAGLDNKRLEALGAKLEFYAGALDLFAEIKSLNDREEYREFGISFENYIVSTGFKRMIKGSAIAPYVTKIWGADLVDAEIDGVRCLKEIAYSLDNTTKTRALFEINKGVGVVEGSEIDVNTKIPEQERRIQFCNMVYIADGPSDIPAFSVLNKHAGAALAVYKPEDVASYKQADALQREQRVQQVAPADYRKGQQAYLWLMERIKTQANQIIQCKKSVFLKSAGTPKHLI